MDKTSIKIGESILEKLGSQVKSVLTKTKQDKVIEVTILTNGENQGLAYEEAYSIAKQPKTEIIVIDSEEFFEKIMDNDIETLEKLRNSDVAADPTRFITPIKILVDSGKVFGQREPLELTAKARERFEKIDALKHEAISKLFSAIITSANAALLARGYSMPAIKELPESLKECFVNYDLLEKKYVKICERVLEAYTRMNEDKPVELWEFSQLSYETEIFLERMKTLVK